MNIEVNINPDQVNEYVTKAILESNLGKALEESVKRVFQDYGGSYSRHFDEAVRKIMNEVIWKIVRENYQEKIAEFVQCKMTDEVLNDWTSRAFDRLILNG